MKKTGSALESRILQDREASFPRLIRRDKNRVNTARLIAFLFLLLWTLTVEASVERGVVRIFFQERERLHEQADAVTQGAAVLGRTYHGSGQVKSYTNGNGETIVIVTRSPS